MEFSHPAGASRNQVYVDALRKLMGLGAEPANSFASETDTEDAARELGMLRPTGAELYDREGEAELMDDSRALHEMSPLQQERGSMQARSKVGMESALARAKQGPATEAALALEREKGNQARLTGDAAMKRTQEFMGLQSGGAAGGTGGPDSAGRFRAHVNEKGEASFTQDQRRMLPSGLMERVAGSNESLRIADELERQFPQLSGMSGVGPGSGRVRNFLQMVPGIPGDADWAKFQANTATLKNSIIKAITGAQMSTGEAERITQQIPLETDKPEVWSAKMQATKANLRGLVQKIHEEARGTGVDLGVSNPDEDAADDPLGIRQFLQR